MSKISNYALELTEQAQQMGFDSLQDALDAGFIVNDEQKLVASDELSKEVAEGHRLAGLLRYSDNELKDELVRRDRENDHRAPVEQ